MTKKLNSWEYLLQSCNPDSFLRTSQLGIVGHYTVLHYTVLSALGSLREKIWDIEQDPVSKPKQQINQYPETLSFLSWDLFLLWRFSWLCLLHTCQEKKSQHLPWSFPYTCVKGFHVCLSVACPCLHPALIFHPEQSLTINKTPLFWSCLHLGLGDMFINN